MSSIPSQPGATSSNDPNEAKAARQASFLVKSGEGLGPELLQSNALSDSNSNSNSNASGLLTLPASSSTLVCSAAAVASSTPSSAARASQLPNITTVSGPKDTGCGGFDWKVWFDTPAAAGKDGWVIQEINAKISVTNADGSPGLNKTYHFWEAWPIKAGKKITTYQDAGSDDNDDEYFQTSRPNTKGDFSGMGKAKFYEGPLPPDFKDHNPDTVAGTLPSSTTKPDFWDGDGTRHQITATWDCTGSPKISSVSALAGDTVLKGTK